MDAVGDMLDGDAAGVGDVVNLFPHFADLSVKGRDAVAMAAEAKGKNGHAKFFAEVGGILAAEGQEVLLADAEIVGVAADVFDREFWIEAVIAGRDGRVRGEDAGIGDATDGGGAIDRFAHQQRDSVEGGEGGVTLVHVNDGWGLADRVERDDPADAQENLLLDAVFAVAAVKVMGQRGRPVYFAEYRYRGERDSPGRRFAARSSRR